MFRKSQMFEMNHDQSRNRIHAGASYAHLGRARTRATDNGSYAFAMEDMSTRGVNFSSNWNAAPRSNVYTTSNINMALPHYHVTTSGRSYDPFLHASAVGNLCNVMQNHVNHSSSSGHPGHVVHGIETLSVNPTVGSGRGCKRRRPRTSAICESGSLSGDYGGWSSSDLSISSDLPIEKPDSGYQHWPWNRTLTNTSYRGISLSIAGEGSQRNVRSRYTPDLEINEGRSHVSSNSFPYTHSAVRRRDHSGTVDHAGLRASATTWDWNRIPVSSAAQWRILPSATSSLSSDMNQFPFGSNGTNGSGEIDDYHLNFISRRNPVLPQNIRHPTIQAVRGRHNNYTQRVMPSYRAMSNHPRLGHVTSSSADHLQLEIYSSSMHSRPLTMIELNNSDGSSGSRTTYDRVRSLSDEAVAHNRLATEGPVLVDHPALYGSRDLLDQHRDMRLDVDSMSYEELLALGERIGEVSTGLSEELILKCLTETIHSSSDQRQEEETCIVCLEEYKNKEVIGTLMKCGHNYHAGCIKKWLSTKNACPICKAPALEDC